MQYAELNKILPRARRRTTRATREEYGLDNTGRSAARRRRHRRPEGWDAAGLGAFPNSGGALVGIVDTGIRATHEDLAGKVAYCAKSQGAVPILGGSIQEGTCADDNGHGSHTSGTITANTNNGKGVAGVAFNSQLAVCKALGGPLGQGSTSDVANCIVWAHNKGAKVISMSLGGGDSTTLHNAVQTAWAGGGAGGTVLVAAAGNDGDSTVNYPAGYAEVVSVAATDTNDQRASFSNQNADVEIAGAGRQRALDLQLERHVATRRCRGPRWRPRMSRAPRRSSGTSTPRRPPRRSAPSSTLQSTTSGPPGAIHRSDSVA